MSVASLIESVPSVCDVRLAGPQDRTPDVLVELPHGATQAAHFHELCRRLAGPFPDGLEQFFFVNTDVGAPECAAHVARRLAEAGRGVVVLRCLVPRTLIDCNRVVDADRDAAELTPGIPDYVRDPEDIAILLGLHDDYQRVAREAFASVCGGGGLALTLHSYAPRSIRIERLDDDIVRALREAYEPRRYESWPRRPDVEVISGEADGKPLAPPALVAGLKREYAAAGVEVAENATYRLHRESMGWVHSDAWPGRVVCVELNRALLADPFDPFREMRISDAAAARLAAPLARALDGALGAR